MCRIYKKTYKLMQKAELSREMITGYPNGKYTNEETLNFTVAKKLNVYISPPNSFIETLILNPLVFGDVTFGRRLCH